MEGLKKKIEGDRWVVTVAGRLDRPQGQALLQTLEQGRADSIRELCLDMSQVASFETIGVALLIETMRYCEEQGIQIKLRSPQRNLLNYLNLVDLDRLLKPAAQVVKKNLVEDLGIQGLQILEALKVEIRLAGETFYWGLLGWLRGAKIRWDRIVHEMILVGVNAVPIVLLIAVLMGVILALQAAAQLRQFGADIFIADLVGVSITREIGPLLTAIIVAGRSGSANAAEIGTMIVSEEIDALRQMGIKPTHYLFLPKIIALMIAIPCLGVLADFVGIAAGAILTTNMLDIGMNAYLEETRLAVIASDLYHGLFKCTVFGLIIGVTGCARGMLVKGGADEVGRAATTAVVFSIFYIITADAFFTWIFQVI